MTCLYLTAVCLFLLPIGNDHAKGADQPSVSEQVHRDIAYAKPTGFNKRLTSLDVYALPQSSGQPIMIWIHGGGWQIGDKARVQSKPQAFVDNGFVFVSVNYRLVPKVNYKEQAGDIANAIHWVHGNAKKFGGNAEQMYVMGHSAGAHLAALVATDEQYLKAQKLPLTAIKGVVLLDGAGYDITKQMGALAGPRNRKLYTTVFGTDGETWKDASPIRHISKDKDIPPFLILYVADRRTSRIQSEGLAAALNGAGVTSKVIPAKDKTHATINREFGQSGDEPTKAVFQFLKRREKDLTRH